MREKEGESCVVKPRFDKKKRDLKQIFSPVRLWEETKNYSVSNFH